MPLAASRTGVWLAGSLLALFLFRLWFAAALPLTGDEAYFVVWGQQLAGGYYDHPPMVGWWRAALLQLGRAEWWLRLPAVLAPFLLAGGAAFGVGWAFLSMAVMNAADPADRDRAAGLVPFAVSIDSEAPELLPQLFGAKGFAWVRRPADLPQRLTQLYASLSR